MQGIIKFIGNPWPKGHPLKLLQLAIYLHEESDTQPAHAVLSIKLTSQDYFYPKTFQEASDEILAQEKANPDLSNWDDKANWSNFHACELGTASTHPDLKLDFSDGMEPESALDGFEKFIDPIDEIDLNEDDYDEELAVAHCYILGHDLVADHKLKIIRDTETELYAITWSGKYAGIYCGEEEFNRDFQVNATAVPFHDYSGRFNKDDRSDTSLEYRERKLRELSKGFLNGNRDFKFEQGEFYSEDRLVPID